MDENPEEKKGMFVNDLDTVLPDGGIIPEKIPTLFLQHPYECSVNKVIIIISFPLKMVNVVYSQSGSVTKFLFLFF